MKMKELKMPKFQGKFPTNRTYNPERGHPNKPPSHDKDKMEGREKGKPTGDRVSAVDQTKIECYRCHRTGHMARDCPERLNYSRQEWNNFGRKPSPDTVKKQ